MSDRPPLNFDLRRLRPKYATADYDEEQVFRVVMAWLVLGNMRQAAEMGGVKYATARKWKTKEWWDDLVAEGKKLLQDELDAKLTGLIEACIKGLVERVTKGDEVLDKNGQILHKAVSASQLSTVLGILFDKRSLIRGDPTSRVVKVSVKEQLTEINTRMEEMAKELIDKQQANEAAKYGT